MSYRVTYLKLLFLLKIEYSDFLVKSSAFSDWLILSVAKIMKPELILLITYGEYESFSADKLSIEVKIITEKIAEKNLLIDNQVK